MRDINVSFLPSDDDGGCVSEFTCTSDESFILETLNCLPSYEYERKHQQGHQCY